MVKLLVLTITLVSLTIAGCSKDVPAPLGDKLVWSSNGSEERPTWTTVSKLDSEGVFVGQSLFHATERSAVRNAELDASRQVALAQNQSVTVDQTETMDASSGERSILDANANTNSKISQTAVADLEGLKTKEVYLENWTVGTKSLWKAFVLVKAE